MFTNFIESFKLKFKTTLIMLSALSLAACSTTSTLDVPPSTRASIPPIPQQMDRDVEPLGNLVDGSLGELALENAETGRKYGVLAERFNSLRQFYKCVQQAVNSQQDAENCVKGVSDDSTVQD